jgi:hypothetical protein
MKMDTVITGKVSGFREDGTKYLGKGETSEVGRMFFSLLEVRILVPSSPRRYTSSMIFAMSSGMILAVEPFANQGGAWLRAGSLMRVRVREHEESVISPKFTYRRKGGGLGMLIHLLVGKSYR